MANGDFELTDEDLEAYRDVASTFSPGMRELYSGAPVAAPAVQAPPVPLPMRAPQRFVRTNMTPPQVDPMEVIRKRINEIDFKTKEAAVKAATKFEAMRQYQQDLAAGKDPTRWLKIIFQDNPSVIPGMMREYRLATPPGPPQMHSLTNPATGDVLPYATYAGRGQFVPRSALPQPPLSTNVAEFFVPGTTNRLGFGVPTGPQTRRFVPVDEPKLTPSQAVSALNANIKAAESALKRIPADFGTFAADETIADEKKREEDRVSRFNEFKEQREAIKSDINAWREQLKGLVSGAGPARGATLPSPSTKSEYDALPAGARYLDPTGVERIKK